MARPLGSHLCLLVLLSHILPAAVATERDLSENWFRQGTKGWIPGKYLKAEGTWEQRHSRATVSRTPTAADSQEKAWGLPGKRSVSSDGRDKSPKGDYSDSSTTSSTAKDSWSQANTGSIVGHGSSRNISTSPTSTATTERTSSATPSTSITPTSTVTTERISSTPSASTSPTPTHKATYLASSTSETKVTPISAPMTTRNPCQNNGKWNETHCRCSYGFEGKWCENKVGENPFCKNGGYWIDDKCECSAAYTGPHCEYVVGNIELKPPEIVEAQVEVSLKVQQTFSEELKDKSSEEFRKFNETFTKQMNVIYNGTPGYRGVRILQLSTDFPPGKLGSQEVSRLLVSCCRENSQGLPPPGVGTESGSSLGYTMQPGSVVVEHKVLFEVNFREDLKEVLKNLTDTVKTITASASDSTTCAKDKLCFSKDSISVKGNVTVNYDLSNECKKKVGKDLAEFFYTVYKDRRLNCVSLCTPGFSHSVNCNRGKCELERSGPKCYCTATDTHWYSGAACENRTSKTLVLGLVSMAMVFALALVITLLSLMLHSKREARRQKARATQMEQWRAADDPSDPGSSQNKGFESSDEPRWEIPMNPMNHFQPTMNHMNSFQPNASLMHLGNQIRISRPQVKMYSC